MGLREVFSPSMDIKAALVYAPGAISHTQAGLQVLRGHQDVHELLLTSQHMSLTSCNPCRRGCLLHCCHGGGYRGCSGGPPSGWHPCGGILARGQGGSRAVRTTRSAQSAVLPLMPSSAALHARSPATMACRTCLSPVPQSETLRSQRQVVVGYDTQMS